MQRLQIGISSCLAGNRVRYDGADKLQRELVQRLEQVADLLPICPEVAIGMGVPRPPIQLTDSLQNPVARQVDNPEVTYTRQLQELARQVAATHRLDGFVFKARSPSCGLHSTPVFIDHTEQSHTVSGIFTATLLNCLPGLPAIDETGIDSDELMEEFVQDCLGYRKTRSDT